MVLDEVTRSFPPDTVHVAVVDPGVGTDRSLVMARFGDQRYLAPDNGLLGQLCRREPPSEIIVLTNRDYWLGEVSSTFHGRDILAPVAAYISLGLDPIRLGTPGAEITSLNWPAVRVEPRRIEGTIVSFDSFGNLITDISMQMLETAPSWKRISIRCEGHEVRGIVKAYAQRPPGSLAALIGSNGLLELAVVNGNAARTLGLPVGAEVKVTW
jgi:S-adenosylmethionine hydrolase